MRAAIRAYLLEAPAGLDDAALVSERAFSEYAMSAGEVTLGLVREQGCRLYVVRRGDERVGFAITRLTAAHAHLMAMAVKRASAGAASARPCFASPSLRRARAGELVSAVTAQANVEALLLFLKQGSKIEPRVPGCWVRGQDACVVSKALQGARVALQGESVAGASACSAARCSALAAALHSSFSTPNSSAAPAVRP